MSDSVTPELQNKLIAALADYFSAVELDEDQSVPNEWGVLTTPNIGEVPAGVIEWTLGYEGMADGTRWPVSFVQIREGGEGVGEFPAYTACVELQESIMSILSFYVRFVLYKDGEPHAVHHYNPEIPIIEFDWDGPFAVSVGGGMLHLFERELYLDMTDRFLSRF